MLQSQHVCRAVDHSSQRNMFTPSKQACLVVRLLVISQALHSIESSRGWLVLAKRGDDRSRQVGDVSLVVLWFIG